MSILQSLCNCCAQETAHDILCSEVIRVGVERSYIVCCGCKANAIREEHKNIIDAQEAVEIIYKPPRLWVYPPKWLYQLETLDPQLFGLLEEVYLSANGSQSRLLAMGVRAALDHTMLKIIGDKGGFEQKLDEMVKQKHLSERQKDSLSIVIDCGSAAAHRGFKPARDLLQQMVAMMEAIIRDHYITGPMLQTLQNTIPPKPPRQKNP